MEPSASQPPPANVAVPSLKALYGDDPARSAEYLRQVLPLLSKYGVAANPVNFAVFYDYVAGRSAHLTSELEGILAGSEPLTDELTQQLFLRHVCPCDGTVLEQLRSDLKRIVDDVLRCVANSGGDSERVRVSLEHHARRIAEETDPVVLTEIVAAIINETRALTVTGRSLVDQLSSTAAEIQTMREELERLREEASTDTLTGALNRRAFDAALRAHMERARSTNENLCLLLVDIDHFKRVNDSYGHLVGDKVLRLMAAQIRRCTKGQDLVARYGGEEFAVILPQTPISGARAVAESIRVTIQKTRLKRADTGEGIGNVTVSVGVARYRPGDDPETVIRRCDEALYQAKGGGRNRVALAP